MLKKANFGRNHGPRVDKQILGVASVREQSDEPKPTIVYIT